MANEIQAEGDASNKIQNVPGVTSADLIIMRRKTLNPYQSVTALNPSTPYTTDSITAGSPVKVAIPTTPISLVGFSFVDQGGGDIALEFTADELDPIDFDLSATTGMRSGTNNIITKLYVYKNGAPVAGGYVPRKVGTGSDTAAIAIIASFSLVQGDIVEVYAEFDGDSTLTFDGSSIIIREVN